MFYLDSNISEVFKTLLNNTSTSSSNNNSSQDDLSITPEMITQLANTIKSNSSSNNVNTSDNTSNSNSENNLDLDLDTILKIKSIIESFNKKDDARSNLLYALKPYLRESRQKKVDQYINLFKLSGITKLFKKEKEM